MMAENPKGAAQCEFALKCDFLNMRDRLFRSEGWDGKLGLIRPLLHGKEYLVNLGNVWWGARQFGS